MEIDEKGIKEAGGELFYSCFKVKENVYEPSPRCVAVTTKRDTLEEANELCEKLIKENIKAKNCDIRKDI